MRKIGAFLVGPVLWVLSSTIVLVIAVVLGLNPDSYIGMGLTAYLASGVGGVFGLLAMRKISADVSNNRNYAVLAIFAFLWIGATVVSGIYYHRYDVVPFRAVSLVMTQIGLLTAWRITAEN